MTTTSAKNEHNPPRVATAVSPQTENALREAMHRLLTGRPQHTDGRLIKNNLFKEAQVSRATMNRAHHILAEWDAQIAHHDHPTRPARNDAKSEELARKLRDKTSQVIELQRKLDAAATVIAALHHDNTTLREQLDRHDSIIDLDARRARPQ
jgi:tRNA A37 N6-isopentenylltransferase MiaA